LASAQVTLTWKELALKNPDVLSEDTSSLMPLYVFSSVHDADRDAGYLDLLRVSVGSLLTSISPSEARGGPKNETALGDKCELLVKLHGIRNRQPLILFATK